MFGRKDKEIGGTENKTDNREISTAVGVREMQKLY